MNLYEIDNAIMSCVDYETGEILDLDYLNHLQMERNRKIENILCWIKNLESDAEQIKEEEKALGERRKAIEKKSESLRNYVSWILNGEKFKTARVEVTYRKSEAVIIDDVKKFVGCCNDEYITFKEPEPNKTKIKSALKAGVSVPGCHLEERNNMSIK